MGFHGFHQRISGLIYKDVRGVLQVFLAYNVLAAVRFTAPVGRWTGTGFTLGFLPGSPAGFNFSRFPTAFHTAFCSRFLDRHRASPWGFTLGFTTGFRAAVTFTELVRRRTGTGFTMGFTTGFLQLLVFVVCKCV